MGGYVLALAMAAACLAGAAKQADAASWLKTGGMTSIPYGHYEFCKTHASECGKQKAAGPAKLDKKRMALLRSVNLKVNRAIRPESDARQYGRSEVWTYSSSSGDCEDYVLAKRAKLIRYGFNAADLRIAMVERRNGEPHAVLVVRTDKGDLVLDNMRDEVLSWERTGYRFIKLQSGTNAAAWVSVGG